MGEGKRWVASVTTLKPAAGSEKRKKTEQSKLNKLCEGHRFNGLKLVKKPEISP